MITVSQSNGDEPISSCTPKRLYEALWGFLVDYAIRFTLNEEDAEDIVSTVFVKLLNTKRTFPTFLDAKAYLCVSVRNACFDYLAKAKKDKKRSAQFSYFESNLVDDELLALHKTSISDQHLQKVMSTLSAENRFFLDCCLDKSLSMAEVAAKTGHTVKGAYNKKSLLLKDLRNELTKYRH
ncbi:RNA polymerase sigma factor [Pseudoflavitalea rhizosphaerae]|uniref:RNA polymerase sigma factor n=1 Tax=Pseudoflavitalea rhizosphaerae TaxID=1884793 RepID=UPI000F8CCA46|nr:sigma-70 family RNA polymerase sigma factor [Pseudoflavitalea rhizosphaerae]